MWTGGKPTPRSLENRLKTPIVSMLKTVHLGNNPCTLHTVVTMIGYLDGALRAVQVSECLPGEALDSCQCASCERVRAAERHESAARRLRAAGEDHRARLETRAAAAARAACAPRLRPSLISARAAV
jgi:hypothetical protein